MKEPERLARLVDDFGNAQKKKLIKKWSQGRRGWEDDRYKSFLVAELCRHVKENDWLDVGNFAMFLWNFERYSPAPGGKEKEG
jgi:hypothetical protein